jgi:hypothetical protein
MATLREQLRPALLSVLTLNLSTGALFPLTPFVLARPFFPAQINGSLLTRQGVIIGSNLIGQNFTGAGYRLGAVNGTAAVRRAVLTAQILTTSWLKLPRRLCIHLTIRSISSTLSPCFRFSSPRQEEAVRIDIGASLRIPCRDKKGSRVMAQAEDITQLKIGQPVYLRKVGRIYYCAVRSYGRRSLTS